MTQPIDIDRARSICNAASEGPWRLGHSSYEIFGPGRIVADSIGTANAVFVIHARTVFPQALDEIDQLRAERERLGRDLETAYANVVKLTDELDAARRQHAESYTRESMADPSPEAMRIAAMLHKLARGQVEIGHVCNFVLEDAAERVLRGEQNANCAPNDNTGLPCPDCGVCQPRVNAGWIGDELHVRLSFSVDRAHASAEVLGVGRVLRMLAPGDR